MVRTPRFAVGNKGEVMDRPKVDPEKISLPPLWGYGASASQDVQDRLDYKHPNILILFKFEWDFIWSYLKIASETELVLIPLIELTFKTINA